jgi:hypothetical protein
MRVYVAGPYSKGGGAHNVRLALEAGETLLRRGYAPYVPHLNHLWHLVFPHGYETWLWLDMEYLETCDALLRLPGESPGADREVERAKSLGIPVYYDLAKLP